MDYFFKKNIKMVRFFILGLFHLFNQIFFDLKLKKIINNIRLLKSLMKNN